LAGGLWKQWLRHAHQSGIPSLMHFAKCLKSPYMPEDDGLKIAYERLQEQIADLAN